MINFSTKLTIARILLSPCVMFAIFFHAWLLAGILFCIAASTDFFDGYYARLYEQETELGKILDPIADKILLFSTLWALYNVSAQRLLPWWFVFLFIIKDLVIVLGGSFLILQKKSTVFSPSLFSKYITALLMVFILYLILVHYGSMNAYFICVAIQFFTVGTLLILLDYSYKFYLQIYPRIQI
jgi:cardiolipin synthase